eukprot:353524-Chlamydomonas_euryale.AAC.2
MFALQEDAIGQDEYPVTRVTAAWFGLGMDDASWAAVKDWQFCAGGLQGFVRGSAAEADVLRRVVDCSLDAERCLAPPGSSRVNHNFDQTAFTLAIRAANFTCLPRESHCMWSVKKVSRDPLAGSAPIEVVSRGHRIPKPYAGRVRRDCPPLARVWQTGWQPRVVGAESIRRKTLMFKITKARARGGGGRGGKGGKREKRERGKGAGRESKIRGRGCWPLPNCPHCPHVRASRFHSRTCAWCPHCPNVPMEPPMLPHCPHVHTGRPLLAHCPHMHMGSPLLAHCPHCPNVPMEPPMLPHCPHCPHMHTGRPLLAHCQHCPRMRPVWPRVRH